MATRRPTNKKKTTAARGKAKSATSKRAASARAASASARKGSSASSSKKQSKRPRSTMATGKVGSDRAAARRVGGKLDFGAPEDKRRDRDYVSQETKSNDPGGAPLRVKVQDGARESGAGGPDSGPGSSSGGDLDTDIV